MSDNMTVSAQQLVGREYEAFSALVEKGRIGQFANAIGQTDSSHFDEEAAIKAGYRGIVAPLTFAYTITLDAGQSFNVLDDIGVEKTRAVHGEQGFTYHNEICAGDTISGQQKVVDVFEKKGGALTFIITDTRLENQLGEHVADLSSTIVVRNG